MKRIANLIPILTLFLLYTANVTAQNAVQFTSDEGLSSSCVRRIYEDSRHNVWICTRNGLNRYDGSKINVYHHDSNNPQSLGHDIVTYILEMDTDHILVGHEHGVQSYNYATNTFTDIPMIHPNGDTLRTHIIGMYKFINGEVHVCATAPGSYIIRKQANGELQAQHTFDYTYNDIRPNMLLNTSDNEVWTINSNGDVVLFSNKKAKIIEGAANVNRVCQGKNGTVYASTTNNGLLRYDSKKKRFEPILSDNLPAGTVIKSMRSSGNGQLLICTDGNGLKCYDERTHTVSQSVVRASNFSLDNSNVEDAMYDNEGNLWVGVYWKGVIIIPKASSTFEYVGHRSMIKNTIGSNCVTSVLPSRYGGVWVATDHAGLYRTNDDCTQSQNWNSTTTQGVPETISCMLEDGHGTLWVGSSIGSISLMNAQNGTFTPLRSICPEASDVKLVFDIKEDEQHCIWIASMGNGLFRYNPETRSIRNYTTDINTPWVECVATYQNRIYVGSVNGLIVYEIKTDGSLERLYSPLQSLTVSDIAIDDNGMAWIATSRGLYSITPNGDVQGVTVADGLPDNHVCSVELEKSNGELTVWAATDHGLCRIETKNGRLDPSSIGINTFFVSDGLQGNEFCSGVASQRDGVMYFGGINGLNYFKPSNIDKKYAERNLDFRIVDFYIFGSPVHAGDKSGSYEVMNKWVAEADELHVCHSDNTFSLELATVNLITSSPTYEYCINDGEWISLGEGQNRISFTNMAAGTYHIRIRAMSYNQQSQERAITIVVHPAWYASPIAYIAYLLLLLLAAYFISQQVKERMAARRVLMRHRQEEELNEARIQFFMNISHEIRTPMTLILAPLEKLRAMDSDAEHQHNYKLIYQNAHRILRLINQLMDVRKIEKGQFSLQYTKIDIIDFIQSLYDVYETSAKNRSIDFKFEHEGIDSLEAMVDTSSFDKIVMNLLSNAFKFTPDEGSISISLTTGDDGLFTLKVTDTGVGISDDEKGKVFKRFYSSKHQNGYIGTGIGLNLTALLVKLHQGEIHVVDNPAGQGSQFVVSLPIEAEGNVSSNDTIATVVNAETVETSNHEDLQATDLLETKTTTVRHRNLLVVEDDTAIRQYIHSELSADFVINECSNGMEGWEYVQRNPDKVDLIISDIMMPLMDGTTLCQKVKNNFTTSHIPVILMSAKTTEADRIAGISIGADAYVTKPFNVELLRTTALNILKQRQMLKGKFITTAQQEGKIEKIELTSPDEHLMERVMKVINNNMDNPDLSVEFVADKVGVSRVHFHRKIKELTGQTPRDFIKSIRLKEAARLLSEKHLDITDVSIATGFKSLSTFSTSFKQVYGQTPSEYMRERLG